MSYRREKSGRKDMLDPKGARTYPIRDRRNLVSLSGFCRPLASGMTAKDLIDAMPDILASKDLRKVADAICGAREADRPVVLAMGGHVIKVGLGPLVADLVDRGIVTAVAMNGAAAIHDLEVALIGGTSEDVADGLKDGDFGMADETGKAFAEASEEAASENIGLGEALGRWLSKEDADHCEASVLFRTFKAAVPCTVHVAMGADIVHMHPSMDGATTGKATMRDFHTFASVLGELEGGVFINTGSAVVLPEVFVKALNLARNLGRKVKRFTTVNMDMIQHYRPGVNVVRRPTGSDGEGYALTGHHEIMIPLLSVAVLDRLGDDWTPPSEEDG
jgi:pterin-4a-carbinolamine dehydratase